MQYSIKCANCGKDKTLRRKGRFCCNKCKMAAYEREHPRQKIGHSLALEVLPDGTVKLPAGRYVLRRLP